VTTLIVIAKEPLPGRAKTRLHPPLSLEQAAQVAAAAIADTLQAMQSVPASHRILLFEGDLVPAGAEDYEIVPQAQGGLDERLATVFDRCDGPTLLIGMETPQVTTHDVAPAFAHWPNDVDAWFGPASDGGFWALGLRNPAGDLIRGIPMSRDDTGARQLDRLHEFGLKVGLLPTLTDVDTVDDALEVAALAPGTRFAATLESFMAGAAR